MTEVLTMVAACLAEEEAAEAAVAAEAAEDGEQAIPMRMRVAERDRLLQMLYECVHSMDDAADVADECAQKELGPTAAQALRAQRGCLVRAITQAIALLEAATPRPCIQDDADEKALTLESVQESFSASTMKTIALAAAPGSAGSRGGRRRYAWGPAPLKAPPPPPPPRANLAIPRLATTSSSVTNTFASNRVSALRNVTLSGAKTLTNRPNSRSSTNIRTVQKATPISSKSITSFAPRPISRVSSRKEMTGVEPRSASRKTSRLLFGSGLPTSAKDDKRCVPPVPKTSSRAATGPLAPPAALKRCITSF